MDGNPVDDVTPPRPSRVDALLTRLGVVGVPARDAALAGVVLVVTLAMLVLLVSPAAAGEDVVVTHRGALVALGSAQAVVLALRRTRPVLTLALVVLAQIGVVASVPTDLSIRGLAPLVAGYTIGTLLPTRRALAVTTVAVVVETVGSALAAPGPGPLGPLLLLHLLGSAVSYPVAALVGSSVATRRRYLELVRLRAAEAVRAQHATARAAVVAERARMARELHDVAAHHLSGMVVQAAAVERLVDPDPAAAKAGAAWIRAQGKETLDNLRLVVGVLREGPDASDGHAPVPGVADLEHLVATAQGLGARVDLERTGGEAALGPLADVALYRVAQEALANARQHAPGATVGVRLRVDDAEVVLEVRNAVAPAAPPPAGGRQGVGLVGMRERAALVGGTLSAGPTPDGGWSVRIVVPRDRVAGTSGTSARVEGERA
ncbi:sensor histidine kinase [Cellulomonas sp. Marseille-Q8402]